MSDLQSKLQAFVDKAVAEKKAPFLFATTVDKNGEITTATAGKTSPDSGKDYTADNVIWYAVRTTHLYCRLSDMLTRSYSVDVKE